MKLPRLPAPYYWSSLDGDLNIVEGPKDVPRDRLINEIRGESSGEIVGYVWNRIVFTRMSIGSLGAAEVARAETQEEAIQLMYNLFLFGELKGK